MDQDTMENRLNELEERVSNLERGGLAQYHKDMEEARESGEWTKQDDRRVYWAVARILVIGFIFGFVFSL